MNLPFTAEQFFHVFRQYNLAVYPLQFLFNLLALLIVYRCLRKTPSSSSLVCFLLAFFWLWTGVVYHLLFFAAVNKAAFFFGVLFVFQGCLFAYQGFAPRPLSFQFRPNAQGLAGGALVVYALFVYPLLGRLLGHVYPASPTFGLPCPTTIFTLGILLWTDKGLPVTVCIGPLLWTAIGLTAAFALGVAEDSGLAVAALAVVFFFFRNRRAKHPSPRIA